MNPLVHRNRYLYILSSTDTKVPHRTRAFEHCLSALSILLSKKASTGISSCTHSFTYSVAQANHQISRALHHIKKPPWRRTWRPPTPRPTRDISEALVKPSKAFAKRLRTLEIHHELCQHSLGTNDTTQISTVRPHHPHSNGASQCTAFPS